jgi:hypothetical protein
MKMNKFDIIIEKWFDTIDKKNVRSQVKNGWMTDKNQIEIFEFPITGNELKDASTPKTNSVRMGWNNTGKGQMYFWDGDVLHFTVEVSIKKGFMYKFVYNIKTDFLIMKDPNLPEYFIDDKNFKKCMASVDKNMPKVKYVKMGRRLVPIKDFC